MTAWVLATANPHKAREMRAVLASLGIVVEPRPAGLADVDETSDTLEGNALLKARAIATATGRTAVADDTGLFVDALDGQPGVRSARYAGDDASDEQNVAKLLGELVGRVGTQERSAQFRTVIAVVTPDGDELVVAGQLDGWIEASPRGEHGFGYDPVFASSVLAGRTLSEVGAEEKNQVSHRARALRQLVKVLADRDQGEGSRSSHP